MLLAAPETVRREVISTRKMQSVHILFLLMCRYQPGGVHEKTSLWRDLTESRVSTSATVQELLQVVRVWRRNTGRARSWPFNSQTRSSWSEFWGAGRTTWDDLEDLRRSTGCRRFDRSCSWTSSQRMTRCLTLRRLCRLKRSSWHWRALHQCPRAWWKEQYPQVPDSMVDHMANSPTGGLVGRGCWNRRRRRQLETASAVVVHLFSGDRRE